ERKQKTVGDDLLLAQLARHGGQRVALLDPHFGRQRPLRRQGMEKIIVKQPGRERDAQDSGPKASAKKFHDRTAKPAEARRRVFAARRKLVFREIDFDPAFDLAQKAGKWIFSRPRREIRLARVVEGAGVIFELLGQLLIEKIAGAVKRQVELGNRPVGAAPLLDVIIE